MVARKKKGREKEEPVLEDQIGVVIFFHGIDKFHQVSGENAARDVARPVRRIVEFCHDKFHCFVNCRHYGFRFRHEKGYARECC